jgi:hypothetical protein
MQPVLACAVGEGIDRDPAHEYFKTTETGPNVAFAVLQVYWQSSATTGENFGGFLEC